MKSLEFLTDTKVHILFIVLLVFLVFYSSIYNFFRPDDLVMVYSGFVALQQPTNILTADYLAYFRPFLHVLFAAFYSIFGLDYIGYHLFVLVLHSLNSALVYYIARKFTDSKNIALASAVIFATLGIHFDSVLWIGAAYVIIFITLLNMISFIFFMKWYDVRNKYYLILSLILFIIALLTYESSLVLPFIMLLYIIIFSKKLNLQSFIDAIRKVGYHLMVLIPFVAKYYFFQKSGYLVSTGLYSLSPLIFKNLLDFSVSLFAVYPLLGLNYLTRINAPEILHGMVLAYSSILYLILPLCAVYILLKGSRTSKFFLLWFVVTILPFLPFNTPLIYKDSPLGAWHLYGASIGFSILFGIFWSRFYKFVSKMITPSAVKYVVIFLISIFVATNIIVIQLVEKYKYSNTDIESMIKFLKDTHTSFPKGSKLYFVKDSMPFKTPILEMVISLYYQDGPLVPHTITRLEYGPLINSNFTMKYTIYYSGDFEIHEISRDQISSVERGNNIYIFDYIKTDLGPKGVELS